MENKISVGDAILWEGAENDLAVVIKKHKNKDGSVTCWVHCGGGNVADCCLSSLELRYKFKTLRECFYEEMQELDEYVKDQLGR